MKGFFKLKYSIFSLLLIVAMVLAVPADVEAKSKTTPQPDYSLVFDAEYYYDKYEDLEKAFGKNPFLLFNHFVTRGMREGRQANKTFNVYGYAANNLDLILKFGYGDLSLYYKHYITEGYKEGRTCTDPHTPTDDGSGNDDDDPDYSGNKAAILDLLNQARSSLNIPTISHASDVEAAADDRAKEIISNYSHYRPNGRYYTNALDTHKVRYSDSYEVITKKEPDAGNVFHSWMNNGDIAYYIQQEDFRYAGIGCAEDDDGNLYWVLLLTY